MRGCGLGLRADHRAPLCRYVALLARALRRRSPGEMRKRARDSQLQHGGAFMVRICAGRAKAATAGPSMQLFGDGKIQGKGVVAIPPLGRPDTPIFDGASSRLISLRSYALAPEPGPDRPSWRQSRGSQRAARAHVALALWLMGMHAWSRHLGWRHGLRSPDHLRLPACTRPPARVGHSPQSSTASSCSARACRASIVPQAMRDCAYARGPRKGARKPSSRGRSLSGCPGSNRV